MDADAGPVCGGRMNDLIRRKDAIRAVIDLQDYSNGFSDTYDKACIVGTLEEVVPVDAVEVIRCKDCRYYNEKYGWCDCYLLMHLDTSESDYCSKAERKEE